MLRCPKCGSRDFQPELERVYPILLMMGKKEDLGTVPAMRCEECGWIMPAVGIPDQPGGGVPANN